MPLEQELEMEAKGLDQTSQLPKKILIRSEEIREALRVPVMQIVEAICTTLEVAPPELAGDLVDRGITIAGGSSLLRGLDEFIAEKTQLPTQRAEDPLTCVARGTSFTLDNLDMLRELLDTGKEE